MDGVDSAVLAKMPLAEAVLTVWRFIADEERLQTVYDEHRGRCYDAAISFPTMVGLIADALLEHQGSGNQSFTRAKESGELNASERAAYGKLGRMPVDVSVGMLADLSASLDELFPEEGRRLPPPSLADFTILTIDGKTMKRVAKRLKPLRGAGGGVIGGKALVATEYSSGMAIMMAADPDGDAHDCRLVPDLLPQVRARIDGPRLWLADRAFCDPKQISLFAETGDSFVLRFNGKNTFTRDEEATVYEGVDDEGRPFTDECGWIGGMSNRHRRYVRRITLHREGEEDVILVTDLFGTRKYPAKELLELYRHRWHIEQVFQQVTEVFGLERLIGGRPEATVFQFAFCLLLYNQMQLIRGYVVKHQGWEADRISTEQLFVDVRRELIAWAVVVGPVDLPSRTAAETRHRLDRLLAPLWTDRWFKAAKKNPGPQPTKKKTKTHTSVFRVLQAARE